MSESLSVLWRIWCRPAGRGGAALGRSSDSGGGGSGAGAATAAAAEAAASPAEGAGLPAGVGGGGDGGKRQWRRLPAPPVKSPSMSEDRLEESLSADAGGAGGAGADWSGTTLL